MSVNLERPPILGAGDDVVGDYYRTRARGRVGSCGRHRSAARPPQRSRCRFNYPFAGPNAVEAVSWAAHPLYETAPFFVHDVGVVILQAPGVVLPDDEYGVLPEENQLDSLRPRRSTTFTSVGYGLQKSFPDAASWKTVANRVRMVSHPHLIQVNTGFTGPG